MKRAAAIVIAALALAAAAQAIIIRHDRDDAKYLALGAKYPAVCFMTPDGEGTLIAPQWVLTAAHVARDKRIERVRFDDGAEYRIAAKTLHPEWRDGQPHDIALVRLAEPVRGVAPVALYEGSDEAGQTVTFVGRGDHGTGLTGPKVADKKKRAATNVVESADANWLRFTFDEPPAGTDLEGVSGPGDSGGPALIERAGKLYTTGVSVFGSRGKYGPQTYGTREGYTRVSTHAAWIRAMMNAATPTPAASRPSESQSAAFSGIPDTPAGKQFAAFLEVFNAGDAAKMKEFVTRTHAKRLLERASADEMVQRHMEARQQSGGLEFISAVRSSPFELVARVRGKGDGEALDFTLLVEAEPPHGISGFRIAPASAPAPATPSPASSAPAPQTSAQSSPIPATPAGKRMTTWLGVINRGNNDEIARWVRENFAKRALEQMPAEERINVHKNFFAETGGVKLHSIRKSEAHEIEILAQSVKRGDWHRIALRVEPAEPNGVMGFMFDEAQPPAAAGTPPAPAAGAPPSNGGAKRSNAEIAKEMDAFIAEQTRQNRFSGTVLLAQNGQPFFRTAAGKASIRYDVPNRIDTKFNLGSMNKMFTAVSIAQLAEQGKLAFDDKVGKHLPDYPNAAVRDKVTIHHLLTHSSGMGSYWNAKYDATWHKVFTVDDFLKTFVDDPLSFEPGARFQYSNAGFIVLGKIIEKVSGMNYYDYVRENIYKRAGMTDSDAYEMDKEVPNLATGYTQLNPITDQPDGVMRNNHFQHSIKGGPAGGGFSTVADLLRFDQALRGGKLVSAKYAEMLLTGKIAMGGGGMQYGYGFGVQTLPSKRRVVGHNGGAPGINAWLDMYWEEGYTVAVLCNMDRCAQPVVQRAKQLITAQ